MSSKKRTALYLRVSTPDQKPDLQFDGLHNYAERAELEIVGEYSLLFFCQRELFPAIGITHSGQLRPDPRSLQ